MNAFPAISHALRAATLVAVAAACGCASHPVPDVQLAASWIAIERAAGASAAATPAELLIARAKMALAQRLSSRGEQEAARWCAEEAQVDAQLARAKALGVSAVADAARALEP